MHASARRRMLAGVAVRGEGSYSVDPAVLAGNIENFVGVTNGRVSGIKLSAQPASPAARASGAPRCGDPR